MTKKFLFLDFDGVLRFPEHPSAFSFFDPDCAAHFAEVMKYHSDWDVVIISSWREAVPIKKGTTICGIPVFGAVPIDTRNRGRMWEIRKFLSAHPGAQWVVVDDDPLNYNSPMDNLVLCDPAKGFDETIARFVEELLS
jgi:hypothetical protein